MGTSDRITMVTWYRPKSVTMPDTSNIYFSLLHSDRSELLYQFTSYRLDLIKRRINLAIEKLQFDKALERKFDLYKIKHSLYELSTFMEGTNNNLS